MFAEPWESRAFGMAVTLYEAGLFGWPQFKGALIARIARWEADSSKGAHWSFYHHWLGALEDVLVGCGAVLPDDVTTRAQALAQRPTGHAGHQTAGHARPTAVAAVLVALVAPPAVGVRRLALELHPDHGGDEARMQEVNRAFDLAVKATGDLHVDQHHTAEDTGIALGQALAEALGDKKGIARYAAVHLPMDETLTRVAIDISGRPFLVFRTVFPTEKIGAFDCELVREFFQAFAMRAGLTLHVETLYGENSHHIAESCFKGLARALRQAVAIDPREEGRVPSTKGTL